MRFNEMKFGFCRGGNFSDDDGGVSTALNISLGLFNSELGYFAGSEDIEIKS
jgi:hypothetical protein